MEEWAEIPQRQCAGRRTSLEHLATVITLSKRITPDTEGRGSHVITAHTYEIIFLNT